MTLRIPTKPVPLALDQDGVARVGGTRVTLDTVVYAFNQGATAEEIAQQYPSVKLSDVYSVLGFYLHQRDEVERYVRERSAQADTTRGEIETRFDPVGIRYRLIRRSES